MRALLILCLSLLAVVLVAPDAAASSFQAADSGLAFGSLALAGLGAGITVQLRARRFGDDGGITTESFRLDSEADDFATQLESYGDAKMAEGAGPVRVDLAAARAEAEELRGMAVDEILRVSQLNAPVGEDGQPDFNEEEERLFLNSLPPKTLAVHLKKARAKGVSLQTQTSGEEPGDQADEAAYGHVTVR